MSYLEKYCVPILLAGFILYIGYARLLSNEGKKDVDGSFSPVQSIETSPSEHQKKENQSETTFYQRFNEGFHRLSKRVIPGSN